MIELENNTSLSVDVNFLNKIASSLTDKHIELIITTDEDIKIINKEHRGIDKETDVLSFPYEDMPMAPLGSIVISATHVKQKAEEFGHTQDDELALLFIHGLLHLLGFDHEVDNGEMRAEEKNIIEKFNLPNSLIIRTQG
ncbi:rRNA maturation RNase YbeY [Sulfurimonas lithotrophica]|uniref:Endoribonuclease YbeY n=1 Tax=Sulfurimonas lithotrophica TaxID=2590022 RepID=A0A5P8P0Z2_9BACT|nr:rRNA maturation RNase YbeY [Sulfurimonas lithotrophica]QFR49280.1 rRNA maturation RNase YbeY [Sulfurimonas lithotrophica]